MSITPTPSRRATALATLAFASVVASAPASASSAASASARPAPPTPRSAPRTSTSGTEVPRAVPSEAPRLQLPADLDLDGLAAELGVHPGRLEAALRQLATHGNEQAPEGVDPLTALADALGVPPTDVYLAAARHAARTRDS